MPASVNGILEPLTQALLSPICPTAITVLCGNTRYLTQLWHAHVNSYSATVITRPVVAENTRGNYRVLP